MLISEKILKGQRNHMLSRYINACIKLVTTLTSLMSTLQTLVLKCIHKYLTLSTCVIGVANLRWSVVCVCVYLVCVSVCYHTSWYIPCLYIVNKVPSGSLWRFQDCSFHWKRFVQKFWHHLLTTSSFLASWWAPVDTRDSDGFLSRKPVCRSSDSSYDSNHSSLIIANY